MDDDDRDLIEQMLLEQVEEERSAVDHPSMTIAHVVTHQPEEWLVATGLALMGSPKAGERILGSRLVREVKNDRAAIVAAVAACLRAEADPSAIPWLISALGFLQATDEMTLILSFVASVDPATRYAVADSISHSAGEVLQSEPRDALLQLANDADAEVRWSAVFEVGAWWAVSQDPELLDQLDKSAKDSSERIRRLVATQCAEAGVGHPSQSGLGSTTQCLAEHEEDRDRA
jgi:HEAT repeat protein